MKVEEVLDKGFIAHANVKARLVRIINGEEAAEPEAVRADDKCIVGEWIYGPGKSFEGTDEYEALKNIHKDFHQEAYNALMLNKSNKKAEAMDHVNSGPFEKRSVEIKDALRKMKKAATS